MQLWTTLAVLLFTALIYITTRFQASRRAFRKLQRENLVSRAEGALY